MSDLVLYTPENGSTRLDLRVDGGTVWLPQLEIADLFQTTKQNVSLHARNLLKDRELAENSVVKESLTTAADGKPHRTQLFFAEVQNKLLYAATRQTAAELIVDRADPDQPNMALTTCSGSRIRKHDILVARKYLSEDEVDTLNRLVVIFLEQAELRAKQQQDLTLDYWRSSVDRMLSSNDQPLLDGPGSISHEAMKTIAAERYDSFDAKRRKQEAIAADAEDLKAIKDLEKDLKRKGGKA
jgi:hypothetical protein